MEGEQWNERDWLTPDEVSARSELLAEEVAHSDAVDGELADALRDLLAARDEVERLNTELRQLQARLEEGTVQL